jgi:hypothetical protein
VLVAYQVGVRQWFQGPISEGAEILVPESALDAARVGARTDD